MSHEHSHHVTSLPALLANFLALVFLTIITVALAELSRAGLVDFGRFDVFIAIGIATVKALLVALVFMQLAHDKPMNAVILITSLLFVALFLGFALLDTQAYRGDVMNYVIENPKQETP